MKRISVVLMFLALSLSGHCQDFSWKSIGKGAEAGTFQGELLGLPQSISAIRYKTSRYHTDIVDAQSLFADSTSALASYRHAKGAVNASYFNVKKLIPTTFLKDNGQVISGTTPEEVFRTDGILAVSGRRLHIFPCDTLSYAQKTRRFREAIASGPVLLQNGTIYKDKWPGSSFFTRRHPRTIVGTTADGWVYYIVIDGRAEKASGATIAEAAAIAQMLGLKDAINLDGGGSSTLWTEAEGVLSNPCDNGRYDHYGQRRVPNIIMFCGTK